MEKSASRRSRVLDVSDCPPEDVPHYIHDYPLFYDALYYPELYPHYFVDSESCTTWLRRELNVHLRNCLVCRHLDVHSVPRVQWVSPSFEVSACCPPVKIDFAVLQSNMYSHCNILAALMSSLNGRLRGSAQQFNSLANDIPLWLTLSDDHYSRRLLELPASLLKKAAALLYTQH